MLRMLKIVILLVSGNGLVICVLIDKYEDDLGLNCRSVIEFGWIVVYLVEEGIIFFLI